MREDNDSEATRSGEDAIGEIREKRADDDLSSDEREFLESERVRLDPDDPGGGPVA